MFGTCVRGAIDWYCCWWDGDLLAKDTFSIGIMGFIVAKKDTNIYTYRIHRGARWKPEWDGEKERKRERDSEKHLRTHSTNLWICNAKRNFLCRVWKNVCWNSLSFHKKNPLLMVRSIIALQNDNKKPLIRQWNC